MKLSWLWAWLPGHRKALAPDTFPGAPRKRQADVLVAVEGAHDVDFLKRISAILAADDPSLADLGAMEQRGELAFVPFGGGDLWLWAERLLLVGTAQFHLYHRETGLDGELRQRVSRVANQHARCQAVVMTKRSLANYLHPVAIQEACGIEVEFTDDDSVADLVARELYRHEDEVSWEELPRRTKARRRNRVKKWLCTKAAERMTARRLAERDTKGEIRFWLQAIAHLASLSRG